MFYNTNYLGVTIDSKLTWSNHVTRAVAKANSVQGFLQRSLKYCPPEIKASCFKPLIIPILEYMDALHGFPAPKRHLCHRNGPTKSSKVYFNDYSSNTSVTSLLNILNRPTLQNRQINLRVIILYKIINYLIDIPADTLLQHNFSSTHHHHHCYCVPYSRINTHLFSFLPFSIRIWNHLSPQTVCSLSQKAFRDRISKENLSM